MFGLGIFDTTSSVEPVNPSTPIAGDTSKTVEPTETVNPQVSNELREAMFYEQIQSFRNLERFVSGEIVGLTIDSVDMSGDNAKIAITALTEDVSVKGFMYFKKENDYWYLRKIVEESRNPDKDYYDTSIDVDEDLIDILIEEQQKEFNQSIVTELLADKIDRLVFDKVVPGVGTYTIPTIIEYSDGEEKSTNFLIISKEYEGNEYYFVTELLAAE